MKFLTVLLLAFALFGCGNKPAAPAPEPAPTKAPAESAGSVEPPGGGDIGVDPNGWSQAGTALAVTQSTDVWIPQSFTGSMSEIRFRSGPTSTSTSSVTINFPSGAALQVSPGSPATWNCKAAGSVSFSTCSTQSVASIPSTLSPTANGNNATITLPNGNTIVFSSGVSLTFR